jgi:hypothetical protein
MTSRFWGNGCVDRQARVVSQIKLTLHGDFWVSDFDQATIVRIVEMTACRSYGFAKNAPPTDTVTSLRL